MSQWPSSKARRVLAALFKLGWQLKRKTGSHRTLHRADWPDFVFAFHDAEELGSRIVGADRETHGAAARRSLSNTLRCNVKGKVLNLLSALEAAGMTVG